MGSSCSLTEYTADAVEAFGAVLSVQGLGDEVGRDVLVGLENFSILFVNEVNV